MSTGVSVITATYNKADLLRRTVASVLDQTVPPLEVLVADDGSTDHTAQVLAGFGGRVTHLRLPHRGQPAAPRNEALRRARGDWVAFVDHDDLWRPDKLERQLARARPGVGILCSNASLIDAGDRPLGRNQHEADPLAKEPDPVRALIGGNFVICSSVLARADVVREAGGFSEDPVLLGVDDYDLWMRCALRTGIAYDPEPLVLYRWGHGNLSVRDPPMTHVAALELVRRRFIEAAGDRARGDLREPLRRNWRRLQHARYKAELAEGRWWRALAPWASVQLAKLRGRS
jgi:glycosyltransferase involved in cell wall biosynthesis